MIYCVVPPDVAPKVRRGLERALRGEPDITMIRERRLEERRATGERRGVAAANGVPDRRRIRYADGRRVAERRALQVPSPAPACLAAYEERVLLAEALQVPEDLEEAIEAVRAITRHQAGDEHGFAEVYSLWFDQVYGYLRVALGRDADADRLACRVFADVLEQLSRVAPGPGQVRAWLFATAHRVSRGGPLGVGLAVEPVNGNGHERAEREREAEEDSLEWLSDEDLLLLIEHRPEPERHVLALRYLAGLSFAEIGGVMALPPRQAIELHRAALRSLDGTLAAVSRSPRVGGRHAMSRLVNQTPVLARRRRALLAA